MPDTNHCAHTTCRQPRCIDRVTKAGRIRWSAWCTDHRQQELATLAEIRRRLRSTDRSIA